MAGSDDMPEETGAGGKKEEAKANPTRKSRSKSSSKAAPASKGGAAKADDRADAPAPVESKDAPSGAVPDQEAGSQVADPIKAGPTGKGPEVQNQPTGSDHADGTLSETETDSGMGAEPGEATQASETPETKEDGGAASPPPVPALPPKRPSAIPMIFGGIIAGLIGFAAAWYIWGLDASSAEVTARLDALDEEIAAARASASEKAAAEDLAALAERVTAVETAPEPDNGATEATLADQAEALTALTARIEALEKAPVEGSQDPAAQAALAAYGREVEALRKEMAEQMARMNAALEAAKETEAEAAARQEEAATAAARAAEQQALLEVQQALDTGVPYDEALGRISSAEVPEGLSAYAAEGVVSLDALRASFPAAARRALRIAREETAGEDGGGFGSWITRQIGARSLEPKEGDDADAVLSRAEAALNAGDLAAALEGLAMLPPGGQAAMDQWIAQAKRRNDAVTGAEALSATLASK